MKSFKNVSTICLSHHSRGNEMFDVDMCFVFQHLQLSKCQGLQFSRLDTRSKQRLHVFHVSTILTTQRRSVTQTEHSKNICNVFNFANQIAHAMQWSIKTPNGRWKPSYRNSHKATAVSI